MQERKTTFKSGGLPGEAGFTLMELLITVVILSIGLLGLAGLQFHSLRGNQNAYMSSIATAQVWDAADRVRANLKGAEDDHYKALTASGVEDPGCISSGCTTAQLAQYDAFVWHGRNAALLPGGEGVICLDSTPSDGADQAGHDCDGSQTAGMDIFVAKVWWDDDRDPATPLRRQVMSFVP